MTAIGVLALQGDFAEHIHMLRQIGVDGVEVRKPEHLDDLDGLIIPGGESTSIGKLAVSTGLTKSLYDFALERPTWGTCAGAIYLAKHIVGQSAHLGLMDITIERNAFGRQIDSFTQDLYVEGIAGKPLRAVFIRAPIIRSVGAGVRVLACLPDDRVVAAQEGHWLATSFHPELTPDLRLHRYFAELVRSTPEGKHAER